MSWFDGLLKPIMVVVAWIMVQFHSLFSAIGLDPEGGAAWSLSIVGLVIVIRIALIPLFFRQIKASRGMQLIAPQMQAIQKKYKGKTDPASREALQRETMALYRENGTNPFASCLPILLQSPIFFALFRVLIELPGIASGQYPPVGPMTPELAAQAEAATIFGAPLSGTFMQAGVNFPIGVLIYWTTTNLWSMGQQFYTIRRMPAPGSQAEIAMKERKARKAAGHAPSIEDAPSTPTLLIEEKPRGQRQQPKRKDRNKPRVVADDVTDKPVRSTDDDPDGPSTKAPGAPTKPKK